MIDEVISEILEAEKKAGEIIKSAEQRAGEIAASAAAEAEEMRRDYLEQIKVEVGRTLSEAGKKAEEQAALLGKEALEEAERHVKRSERNIQKVVEKLTEILTENK